MANYENIKYFDSFEFDSPDEYGSGKLMQQSTIELLDYARHLADMPFFITSGYRSKVHNERVGGVNSSSHTRGYAVDISAQSSRQKFKIIESALKAGFKRIGISSNFVHLDNDPDKDQNVIWTY